LCGPFGSAIKSTAYVERGVPFIRITNIKLGEFDESDLVYISKADSERLRRTRLGAGDLVISQRGTVGNVCQIPDSIQVCNISANTIGIKPGNSITPKYLLYFLVSNEGQKQFQRAVSGHVQAKITTSDVEGIRVPLPPMPIQDAIATKMDTAYRRKQALEAEAEALLESIDGYVLGELGIELPELKEDQHFVQRAALVCGGRLDPYYHLPKFQQAEQVLSNSTYELCDLGEFVTDIKYGASVKNIYVQNGIPLLRITNLKPNEIDLSEIVQLTPELEDAVGSAYVRENDLLISRSGTIGIVAVVPQEADGFAYGSFMIRFRVKTDLLNPQYVSCVCNSPIGQLHFQRNRIGAVQGNITIPSIKALRIPVPSPGCQREIATEAQRRRKRAQALREEAKQVVAEAKAEVERMILGEGEV
jgi:restriction endonuclease S subunit